MSWPASAIITVVLILIAPIALLIGWFLGLRRIRREASNWRDRISLLSLTLVSLVALLWPMMIALMPHHNWTGAGGDQQMDWVEAWHRPVLRTLLASTILGFFGRPQLIVPIVLGSVGVGLFWLVSTAP